MEERQPGPGSCPCGPSVVVLSTGLVVGSTDRPASHPCSRGRAREREDLCPQLPLQRPCPQEGPRLAVIGRRALGLPIPWTPETQEVEEWRLLQKGAQLRRSEEVSCGSHGRGHLGPWGLSEPQGVRRAVSMASLTQHRYFEICARFGCMSSFLVVVSCVLLHGCATVSQFIHWSRDAWVPILVITDKAAVDTCVQVFV